MKRILTIMAAILKRVALFASAMVVLLACHDIYYQPSFENFPDEEYALPYDREIIPADGDTCWFNYHLEKIMVKAVDIEHPTKDLKWEVLIDGNQYGDTKYNNKDGLVFDRDKWWQERTGLQYSIYQTFFEVPANPSINTRNIEVRASINHSLVPDLDDWGEWETVFSAVQEGFHIETPEAGRILVDYECFVAGKDSETVSMLIGSDPLFMDNGIWKFIEYDIASPTGKIGIEVYDAKGDLLDTGSIMNFGNRCEEFPEVFSKILPNNQVVSQLLWDVNFENFGRRSFYVLIVKGEGPHGIFGPALEVFLFEDITAEYKSEYDIDYAVKRHHLVYVLADNNFVDDSK